MHAGGVTEFMDVTWSYITDSLQNANSLKIFKDKDLTSKDTDF